MSTKKNKERKGRRGKERREETRKRWERIRREGGREGKERREREEVRLSPAAQVAYIGKISWPCQSFSQLIFNTLFFMCTQEGGEQAVHGNEQLGDSCFCVCSLFSYCLSSGVLSTQKKGGGCGRGVESLAGQSVMDWWFARLVSWLLMNRTLHVCSRLRRRVKRVQMWILK